MKPEKQFAQELLIHLLTPVTFPKAKNPKKHQRMMQEPIPLLDTYPRLYYKMISAEGFVFMHWLICHSSFELNTDIGNSLPALKPFTTKLQTDAKQKLLCPLERKWMIQEREQLLPPAMELF